MSAKLVPDSSADVRMARETVRSEMAMPSFSKSPRIRDAPQRQFSAAIRGISDLEGLNRCVVFQEIAASDRVSIDVRIAS